jgi:DNA primase
MRFSPQFLDDIRARLPVSQVVGRKVALKKKGREYAGLSPFKSEKTPSFFVNDQKGFYHCFASGEHGDIFKFVMATEGLTFPEAVERLAGEAGIPMPKTDVRDEAVYDQRQRLYAILEASAAYFQHWLAGSAGTDARQYLDKRGLNRDTRAAFRLGYAPENRFALKEHLGKLGYSTEELALSGMLIAGEDIAVPYDRFRNRVMFPICDAKGRVIAFGGRALDPNAPAKYLNSPETPLFHKGHTLYNVHRARGPAHDKHRIIAVEGYMDVAALHEAGFTESVAPLGTALTEEQLHLLWRMSPEPILCFDGDSAGRKAAWRAIDVALPHLKPGASLLFAFLPDGLDPDDLIRQRGGAAMEGVLAQSRPLADVLFDREWSQDQWTTPERRARLEQQLKSLTGKIADASVRSHYELEMRRRLSAAWGYYGPQGGRQANRTPAGVVPFPRRPDAQRRVPGRDMARLAGRSSGPRGPAYAPAEPIQASSSLLNSALVSDDRIRTSDREGLLLRTLLNHPWLAEDHSEDIAALKFTSPALSKLRDGILSALSLDNSLDTATLRSQLTKLGLGAAVGQLERSVTHRCDKFAESGAERTEVEAGWRHALLLHDRQTGLKEALESAERAWHEDANEDAFQRIRELQAELQRLGAVEDFDNDTKSSGII